MILLIRLSVWSHLKTVRWICAVDENRRKNRTIVQVVAAAVEVLCCSLSTPASLLLNYRFHRHYYCDNMATFHSLHIALYGRTLHTHRERDTHCASASTMTSLPHDHHQHHRCRNNRSTPRLLRLRWRGRWRTAPARDTYNTRCYMSRCCWYWWWWCRLSVSLERPTSTNRWSTATATGSPPHKRTLRRLLLLLLSVLPISGKAQCEEQWQRASPSHRQTAKSQGTYSACGSGHCRHSNASGSIHRATLAAAAAAATTTTTTNEHPSGLRCCRFGSPPSCQPFVCCCCCCCWRDSRQHNQQSPLASSIGRCVGVCVHSVCLGLSVCVCVCLSAP